MPSIDVLFGDHQFFDDSYTNIAEATFLQHCENYFSICRKLKHLDDEKEKPNLNKQLLEEMDYFVHGRFERDCKIMCNGSVITSGNRILEKLDEFVENEDKYPENVIQFYE